MMASKKTMIDAIQEMLEASDGWQLYGLSEDSKKFVIELPTSEQANTFFFALSAILTDHHNTREGYMKFHRTEEEKSADAQLKDILRKNGTSK
jgi:hypothetical protein